MWFLYDPDDRLGVARWMLQRELLFPVPPAERARTPVLTPDGRRPYKGWELDAKSKAWFAGTLGDERARALSVHSGRITLASALGVRNQPAYRIKELCRWKADSSVAGYKRLTPLEYATTVRDATLVCAATLPPGQEVIVDDDGAFRDLEAMRRALDGDPAGDARPAATRPPAQEAGTPRTGGRPSGGAVSGGVSGPRVRGSRVRMLWGDEWFEGTCGANRREEAGWATRVLFDAVDGRWPATASWHVLADEEYQTVAAPGPMRTRGRA